MSGSYTARQVLTAALTANALKPVGGSYASIPSFAAGWLTSELAPQLLALTLADSAVQAARGRARFGGLALAALSVGGLGYLVARSRKVGDFLEGSLKESIGETYADSLQTPLSPSDLVVGWRDIVRPFRMRNPEVEVIRNISYTDAGKRGLLDIYRPKGVDLSEAPVLLQVHGGGWTIGNKDQQGLMLMNRLASRGWICVAINYRLAPRDPFPAQIIDVKKAIAWTRANIASYGGDPAYLAITGGSAGGHLAALAALTPGEAAYQPGFEDVDTSVEACVPFYGVYDMAGITGDRAMIWMRDAFLGPRVFKKNPSKHLADFENASPITHVSADAPDFFVLHGANDSLVTVRQARAFVEKLRAVTKSTVTYSELVGAQHAFEVFSSIRGNYAIRAAERWLQWHRANHAKV